MRQHNTPPRSKAIERFLTQLNWNARTREKGKLTSNGFKWIGESTPTALSITYSITIIYQKGKTKVFLDGVGESDFGHVPHLFYDGSLCLYFRDEWNLLRDGFLPLIGWIDEWLLHYELWKYTGVWTGGGIDHCDIREKHD